MTESDTFKEQGFLIHRQLFTEEEMAFLEEALEAALAANVARP